MLNIQAKENSGDFRKDGILYCGKCKEPKERIKIMSGKDTIIKHNCACERAEVEKYEREKREEEIQLMIYALRKMGMTDTAYYKHKFEADNGLNPNTTTICKNYVDCFDIMKENNIGMVFYGGVGTGKTFFACCIANAMFEKGRYAMVTNFPKILNKIFEDKQKAIDELQKPDLLIIDDFGVERGTEYSLEQMFAVIDTRLRSGRPMIITTNISLSDIEDAKTIELKRIYDRVLEACPLRIRFDGESIRKENAKKKREIAAKVLL